MSSICRMSMAGRLAPVAIGIVWLAGAMAAEADQRLNCGAYATKAVEQQKQNQQLKCGFRGPAWSTNFQGHFAWCNQSRTQMADLTREDRTRDNALQTCHQNKQVQQQRQVLDALCGQYAIDARSQNQENRQFNCRFLGGRWSDDVNGHRAWCMKAGISAANTERAARNAKLNQCKSKGRCTPTSDCAGFQCNDTTGTCFTICSTTMDHCAADYVCDVDGRCKHKSNF